MTALPPRTGVAAVVLAGGFGRRIQHLLPELPKPMAPVAGRPFVEWVVRWLRRNGIRQVVLSTGYRAEVVAAHFHGARLPDCDVRCVPEPAPLGTAGGFLHAALGSGFAPRDWVVVNGDSVVATTLEPLLTPLQRDEWEAMILGVPVDDAARFGSLAVGAGGRLEAFAEKRPGRGLINAGVYAMSAALLARFPADRPLSFESDVFPALLAGGTKIGVAAVAAPFLDIGTPESLPLAEDFVSGFLKELG